MIKKINSLFCAEAFGKFLSDRCIGYAEAARWMGVSPNTVANYAKGIYEPRISELLRFCDKAQVSPYDFTRQPDVKHGSKAVNALPEEPIVLNGKKIIEQESSLSLFAMDQLSKRIDKIEEAIVEMRQSIHNALGAIVHDVVDELRRKESP